MFEGRTEGRKDNVINFDRNTISSSLQERAANTETHLTEVMGTKKATLQVKSYKGISLIGFKGGSLKSREYKV